MRTLLVLAAAVSEMLIASAVIACQCGWLGTDEDAIRAADRVFIGRRISSITVLQESPLAMGTVPLQRYIFAVDRVLKGALGDTATVTTTGGNCDFLFTQAARYAVFLEKPAKKGARRATICLRTREITSNLDPLLRLGHSANRPAGQRRYLLEPIYRPLWASTLFLAAGVVHPFAGPTAYEPHRWLLAAAQLCLAASVLALFAAAIPRLRTRFGVRRLLLGAVTAITLSLGITYTYLRLSIWFAHYLL